MKFRSLFPAFVLAIAALGASPAEAARVAEVRVGDHPDFTRIVIELDGHASYSLEQKDVGGVAELLVDIDAATATRVVTSRSRLIESVTLRPDASGAVARVALRSGPVRVKEMVLKSPPRIVLDLTPAPSRTAAAPALAPAPTAPSDATPKPATAIPAAKPTATASAPRPAAPKPEPVARKTATPAPTPTATTPTPRTVARAPSAAASPTSPSPTTSATKASAAESGAPATGAAGAAPAERKAGPAGAAPKPRPAQTAAKKPAPRPAPVEEPGWSVRLAQGDPVIGLAIAGGGVLFLLLAFLALRRRSQRIAREAASAPWPPPGAVERDLSSSGGDDQEQDEENEMTGPLFSETLRQAQEDAEAGVALPEAAVDAEPEVVAKADASGEVEELARRIERLEARLADSLDVRDRLERQLAAHTEELRVQRAAIARTQRAVRAAVRGPEAADAPAAQPAAQPAPGAGSGEGQGEG